MTVPAGYSLVWADEFEGSSLDLDKWNHWRLGARGHAMNVPTAVSVADGLLTITTYTENGVHYTGMIATGNTFLPLYGYFMARIAFDGAPGQWSGFWLSSPTIGNPIDDPSSAGTEMDVVEHRKVDGAGHSLDGKARSAIHWNGYGRHHKAIYSGLYGADLGSGFHTYGWEWTPEMHRMYVDGALVWQVEYPISRRPQYLLLSSEVQGGSWAGAIPAGGYNSRPASTTKMKVDWVRVYQRVATVAIVSEAPSRLAARGESHCGEHVGANEKDEIPPRPSGSCFTVCVVDGSACDAAWPPREVATAGEHDLN
jgi:beta-glucanase (GH16 family)